MAKRRTDAEIQAVREIHDATDDVARAISARVNPDENDPHYIRVSAFGYWHLKAEYQRDAADTLVVEFSSKDPAIIERVAQAIRAAVTETR